MDEKNNIKMSRSVNSQRTAAGEVKKEKSKSDETVKDRLKKFFSDAASLEKDIENELSELFNRLSRKYTYDSFLEVLSDRTDDHILEFQESNNCLYIGGNIVLKVDDEKGKMTFAFDGYFNETKDGKGQWQQLSFSGSIRLDKFENPDEPQIQEIRDTKDTGYKLPVVL
jgi:hypothetical protein